jgi:hypothetical protein
MRRQRNWIGALMVLFVLRSAWALDQPATQSASAESAWKPIDEAIANENLLPPIRRELQQLRDCSRALFGRDVTLEGLIERAQPVLLQWLQVEAPPIGTPATDPGSVLRRRAEAILGTSAPDHVVWYARRALLKWMTDTISRHMTEHYLGLKNLSCKIDVYVDRHKGEAFEMPGKLPLLCSGTLMCQPSRHRAVVTKEAREVWGMVSWKEGSEWQATEWCPTKRIGPYVIEPPTRRLPKLAAQVLGQGIEACAFHYPFFSTLVGGDCVAADRDPLRFWRFYTTAGVSPLGVAVQYEGVSQLDGRDCHVFTAQETSNYKPYPPVNMILRVYVDADPQWPWVRQIEYMRIVLNHQKAVEETVYVRTVYRDFSTEPLADSVFLPPDETKR